MEAIRGEHAEDERTGGLRIVSSRAPIGFSSVAGKDNLYRVRQALH